MRALVRGSVIQRAIHLAMIMLAIAGCMLPKAHADLLQCAYPNKCFFFDVIPGIGNIRGFVSNGPTEMESQHWHLEYGSGGLSANIGGNAAAMGLQSVSGGLTIGISVTLSWSGWVCPDEAYEAAEPTIIQTWNKDRPKPTKCVPIRVRPIAAFLGAEWPPTHDVNIPKVWPSEAPADPHPEYPGGPGPFPPPPPLIPPAPPPGPGILPPIVLPGE